MRPLTPSDIRNIRHKSAERGHLPGGADVSHGGVGDQFPTRPLSVLHSRLPPRLPRGFPLWEAARGGGTSRAADSTSWRDRPQTAPSAPPAGYHGASQSLDDSLATRRWMGSELSLGFSLAGGFKSVQLDVEGGTGLGDTLSSQAAREGGARPGSSSASRSALGGPRSGGASAPPTGPGASTQPFGVDTGTAGSGEHSGTSSVPPRPGTAAAPGTISTAPPPSRGLGPAFARAPPRPKTPFSHLFNTKTSPAIGRIGTRPGTAPAFSKPMFTSSKFAFIETSTRIDCKKCEPTTLQVLHSNPPNPKHGVGGLGLA